MVGSNKQLATWRKIKLGDTLQLLIDHRGKTPKKLGGDWSLQGVPTLSAKNIKGGRIINEGDIRYVSQKLYDRWMPEKLEKGDILLTSEAPLGELLYLKKKVDYCLSQRLFGLRTQPHKLNSRFLYYYLLSPIGRHQLFRRISGTAAEGIRQAELRQLEIAYPESIIVQKRIADILSAFDDKIELNNKISAVLEQMAQAIFNEWFLKNQKSKIESQKLKDFAKVTMGQSPASQYYNERGEGLPFHQGVTNFGDRFPSHRVYCTENNRIAENGDILLSVRAPVGRVNIANTRISLGRGLAGIREKRNRQSFLYYFLKHRFKREDSLGSGSVFPSVTRKDLEDISVLIPSEEIVEQFEYVVRPMDKKIEVISNENQKLAALRDLLLPKLMSGEVKV